MYQGAFVIVRRSSDFEHSFVENFGDCNSDYMKAVAVFIFLVSCNIIVQHYILCKVSIDHPL